MKAWTRKFLRPWLAVAFLVVFFFFYSSCPTFLVSQRSIERAHGLRLPASSRDFQQLRSGIVLDRGIVSMFEMAQPDVTNFVAQLKINSRSPPAKSGPGDPRISGWNVWPERTRTFVPGNGGFDRLKRTWTGPATPIEMLSCDSTEGDWLHVEVWSISDGALVKVYTDWN